MTEAQLKEVICTALGRVAPEADLTLLAPDANLRETLDIDSFDHLNFLIDLADQLGIEVPEEDYGQLTTLVDIVHYLSLRCSLGSV